MALKKTFDQLVAALSEMANAVRELEVHVADQSAADAVLVEHLEDSVQDLLAHLRAARVAAGRGFGPGDRSTGPDAAATELAACHDDVLEATHKLDTLLAYESISDLLELGRRRGGDWLPWASEVRAAVERCRAPLDNVHRNLLECWQEVAERSAAGSVSVQATNIGQQVTVPVEPAYEGVP